MEIAASRDMAAAMSPLLNTQQADPSTNFVWPSHATKYCEWPQVYRRTKAYYPGQPIVLVEEFST